MSFDPAAYRPEVAAILALDGNGERLMPLAMGTCSNEDAARKLRGAQPGHLFPGAREPEAAMSGLWLYFSCLEESHRLSQDIANATGSFWHGIMHRQEPDASNAGYWFRRAGRHPVFEPLAERAADLSQGYDDVAFPTGAWDPFAFIEFCEQARGKPGSRAERLALEVQRAEWQLLFDYCARATMAV